MRLPILSRTVLALAVALVPCGLWSAAQKPNILLITADDLGCNLSCYGEKRMVTPRLDALAAEGVRFEHAYVAQSSCSPSRAALLTGIWPHQNRQVGLAHLGFRMPSGLPNLPALLQAGGYRTGIIGKLHVEPAADFPFDWMPAEKTAPLPTRDVRLVAARSAEFFAQARSGGEAFFLYVNYFDPHGPFNRESDQVNGLPGRPLQAKDIGEPLPLLLPDEEKSRQATARILNTILRLDEGVGLLLEELRKAGLAENTLVVFVGDNGLAMPRGKTTSYEGGVRVPLIVRWPGVAKPQVRTELVSLLDVMPTLLDAASVPAPSRLGGMALQPLLRGEPAAWREFLFTEMNFHEPQMFQPQRSVRDGRFKLLVNLRPGDGQAPVELFDLQTDPGENRNLAGDAAHASARQRLEQALQQWRQGTGDPLLEEACVRNWSEARERWSKLPRVQAGPSKVVKLPPGETESLYSAGPGR